MFDHYSLQRENLLQRFKLTRTSVIVALSMSRGALKLPMHFS